MHADRDTRVRIIIASLVALAATVLPVWSGKADVAGHDTMSMPTPKPLWQVLGDTPEPSSMDRSRMLKLRIYWPLYLPQLLVISVTLGGYVAWALRTGRRQRRLGAE